MPNHVMHFNALSHCCAIPLRRRNNPVMRNRLFFGVIAVGIVHGAFLIARSWSNPGEEEVFRPPPPSAARPSAKALQ